MNNHRYTDVVRDSAEEVRAQLIFAFAVKFVAALARAARDRKTGPASQDDRGLYAQGGGQHA